MNITKEALVEFLVHFVQGDADSEKMMEAAYKGTPKVWEKSEWIFVKDIEMCLKGINKIINDSGFENLEEVGRFILSDSDEYLIRNPWVRERVVECRNSLAELG